MARYALKRETILECCREGYALGFRTFVMQGGEDPALTDEWIEATVAAIRNEFSDCAITLSLGEKSRKHTSVFSGQERTDTCFGTKHITNSITGNSILTSMIIHMLTLTQELEQKNYLGYEKWRELNNEHELILRALRSHDLIAARAAVYRHIYGIKEKLTERNTDTFVQKD